MDKKISDIVLACGITVFILMALISAEELVGIRFIGIVAMVAITRWVYNWIRSWDDDEFS